jgi:hypothetical protein
LRDLRAWATAIILKRAPSAIANKQAYLKISLREFFQNLSEEAEQYLADRCESFYFDVFIQDPNATVETHDCYQFLIDLAKSLPIPARIFTPAIFARAEQAGASRCHLRLDGHSRSAEEPAKWQRLKDSWGGDS